MNRRNSNHSPKEVWTDNALLPGAVLTSQISLLEQWDVETWGHVCVLHRRVLHSVFTTRHRPCWRLPSCWQDLPCALLCVCRAGEGREQPGPLWLPCPQQGGLVFICSQPGGREQGLRCKTNYWGFVHSRARIPLGCLLIWHWRVGHTFAFFCSSFICAFT